MEKSLTIIITMAGLGTRFRKAGYQCPKYMIEAKGKTLFEWSMDSLVGYNDHVSKYIFVVREEDHAQEFIKQKCEKYGISKIHIVEIDHLTDGQATTCMLAMPYCDPETEVMVYNIDTYVEPYELKYEDISGNGYLPCFHADGDHWSFVRLDKGGNVAEVKEKERISNICTLGAYYFSSAELYQDMYHEFYAESRQNSEEEKYIAPIYNYMVEKGMDVRISMIDFEKVHVLGTPEEIAVFIKTKN